jgi:hypothetical protein
MAVRSELANGYIYIRRHVRGLRIRDISNSFVRSESGGQPVGVKADPLRETDVANCVAVDVHAKGRNDTLTWLYTKDDLPRIINDETHTEFLACVPTRERVGTPIGHFNLVRSYFDRFIDWYRMVTGDISMTGPDHWNSHIPMYSECLVDISSYGDRPLDEIVVDIAPNRFEPRIFHFDVEPNETAMIQVADDEISHEQRIAHYLATGKTVPIVHRRFAEILHMAQETKDWGLVALSMFPVFEQYFDEFMREVGARSAEFKLFLDERYKKRRVPFIGEKIKWLPSALTRLGYAPSSVESYIAELEQANQHRVQVVHYNKQPTFEEAMNFARILTNAVLLCETALGHDSAYVVPLEKLRG